jgi:hypothetical protein
MDDGRHVRVQGPQLLDHAVPRLEQGDLTALRPRATLALLVVFAAVVTFAMASTAGGPEPLAEGGATDPPIEGRLTDPPIRSTPGDQLPADTVAAWTRSRLPDGYADLVASSEAFTHTSLVRSGVYRLVRTEGADGRVVDELPDGWGYPVELLALDPDTYDGVAERTVVGSLAPDEALLSESSAEVRELDVGGLLTFEDGTELEVAGVLPDELVGAGEVVVRADGPLVPDRERYVLVRPGPDLADRDAVEEHLVELLPEERGLRTVALGEEPLLRNSAGVLAPARMKRYFGEFAMQEAPGRAVQTGRSWIDEHITREEVPILGVVECHRELFEPLRAALQDLVDQGLAHLIDPGDYGGCWVPRTQGGDAGPLSSHAWGTSIDFNVSDNHLGMEPSQDPRLVEIMARHGFTWGGDWLLPDAMHFELVPDRELVLEELVPADDPH